MSLLQGPMHHHLNGHKDLTMHKEVLKQIDPDVVWIPLVNGNAPCNAVVKVGDEVKVGTKIAERNDRFYLPLFSPVSGTVTGIEKFMTSGMTQANHLRIQNDHKNTAERAFAPFDYEAASWEELLDFVKNSGMLGLGGAGFPTYVKYLKPENVDLFVVNAVECEPYLTADYKNIEENMGLLKTGTLALYKLSKAAKGCVAIKEDKAEQIAALKEAFAGTPIEIRTVPNIYPMGWERTLVFQLTGKRYGMLPIEAGCILNNASTAIALGRAIDEGMPITHKYVTVSGDAVKNPVNVLVPVGTKAHDIIDACGGFVENTEDVLLIAGGPMMGKAIPNDAFVIQPQNNGLTIMKNRPLDTVKCLRCGRCTETCPSGLQPVRINAAQKAMNMEELQILSVNDCIECGMCTYICPSKIDVTEGIRRAKRYLRAKAPAPGGKK
ncbi:MAG: RnfABCDGE type electron transport complex subunit C [Solobacterium sp.]|nr:RnfABCDGE type electron transport complex subunit C [Solobacterium sp.]